MCSHCNSKTRAGSLALIATLIGASLPVLNDLGKLYQLVLKDDNAHTDEAHAVAEAKARGNVEQFMASLTTEQVIEIGRHSAQFVAAFDGFESWASFEIDKRVARNDEAAIEVVKAASAGMHDGRMLVVSMGGGHGIGPDDERDPMRPRGVDSPVLH